MNTSGGSLFTNLLAIAGCIVVIIVLVWGIIHLTKLAGSQFFSLFRQDKTEQVAETTEPIIEEVATPTPIPSTISGQATPAPVPGTPDLYVQILRAGMTNANEAYVVFDIKNLGTAHTNTWYFTANVPTSGQSQFYSSPAQVSLAPGAHIENTLRFSQSYAGTFTVSVDPQNLVRESNEGNNTANQYLSATFYAPTPIPHYEY